MLLAGGATVAESSRLQPAASLENLRASCESTSDQGEGDRTRSPAPHSAATGGASGWRSRDRVSQSSHTPRGTSLPLVTVTLFHAATKCTRSDPGSGSNSPPPTILQISCPPHVGQGHCRAFWSNSEADTCLWDSEEDTCLGRIADTCLCRGCDPDGWVMITWLLYSRGCVE